MKSLSKAVTALSLALAAGAVLAAPVAVGIQQTAIEGYAADLFSGAPTVFSDQHTFLLGSVTTLSGQIQAVVVDGDLGATPYLDIQSAYLLSATGARYDLTQTAGFDWSHGQSGMEIWALSPVQLLAGEWTLFVSGVGINDKGADGYDGSLVGNAADLPEPAALALVASALAALGLSRRRRAV